MLFTAIFLFVSFDILCIKLNISGRVFCFYIELEFFICCLIFIPFLYDKEKYQKEMKKNLLPLLLKNMFNIETGSNIPVEYVNDISYIKDINSRHIVKVEKKLRNNSFHGEYNGIKFQAEEAYIYSYNGDAKSKSNPFLLLFFKLNKLSNITLEINTKKSSLYKNLKEIYKYVVLFVILTIGILQANWILIIENNLFLMTLTVNFVNWFLKWHLILEIGAPVIFMLLVFIFNIFNLLFICLGKIIPQKTEFETKNKRVNPQFLNLLNELSYVYGANSVNCRLFNGSLIIAIDTEKDLFEIGNIKKPVNQPQLIQTFYQELNIIFKIIDYLVENNEDITM